MDYYMGTISNKLKLIYAMYQIVVIYYSAGTCSAKNVSAFFVFGDSYVEAGNNFYIGPTFAEARYPNGIDFPKRSPSRRFTNSRMIADIIEEELGFQEFSPPYLDPSTTGDVILKGVNYGSAGSGILNSTGFILGDRICMDKQLSNFAKTRQEIISRIGAAVAKKLLRQALYFVVIGNNDIFGSSPHSPSNGHDFLDEVISQFRSQLTMLYNLDARKIAVTNVPPVGCIPFMKEFFLSDGCVGFMNKQAEIYNIKLKDLLQNLTKDLARSTFVYLDYHAIYEDILQNYKSYGFENANDACCSHRLGRNSGLMPCGIFNTSVCVDRTKYIFWDPFHPTESVYLILAKQMLDGGLKYASPMNLRQLANT